MEFYEPGTSKDILLGSYAGKDDRVLARVSAKVAAFLFGLVVVRCFNRSKITTIAVVVCVCCFFVTFCVKVTITTTPVVDCGCNTRGRSGVERVAQCDFVAVTVDSMLVLAMSLMFKGRVVRLFIKRKGMFALA